MPPFTIDSYQPRILRRIKMATSKSEFEDFMNAYRPTLDVPPRREPKQENIEDTKADFGRSIKKMMKRTQNSPSIHSKNRREVIQRTIGLNDRERSVTNELKPPPGAAPDRKAKRPWSLNLETIPGVILPHDVLKSDPNPLRSELNPGPSSKNGTKPKAKKTAATRDREEQVQQKPVETAVPGVFSSSVRAPSSSPLLLKKNASIQDDENKPGTSRTQSLNSKTILQAPYCLIIAGGRTTQFLPRKCNPDPLLSLRIVEVPERKYHVIIEFEECPSHEKPKTSPSGLLMISDEDTTSTVRYQKLSFGWVRESHIAVGGVLLRNVERCSEFSYVTYLVVNCNRAELFQKMSQIRSRPYPMQQQRLHFVAGYEEAITIARPPLPPIPEQPSSERAGFIVSLYQVLPGEDGRKFEQNWVMWTGARQLYSHAPEYMGLKRISIHKSILPTNVINYALICEFAFIMDYLTDACVLIDRLRARCCGFIGVYGILDFI